MKWQHKQINDSTCSYTSCYRHSSKKAGSTRDHVCAVSAYKAEDGTSKTLLTVDLTEEYQALYPEAGITKAVRREYTSANAK